jgi:hypothetical protein
MNATQLELFDKPGKCREACAAIIQLLNNCEQPSARELVVWIESNVGLEARWELKDVIQQLTTHPQLTRANREYLTSLLTTGQLLTALRGEEVKEKETISSIDFLLNQSRRYQSSDAFQEMIDFVGRFRDYAPYNNMLVRLQNPSCSFYATAKDWHARFNRAIKQDARPMLILAPMHPVMLVYDLDQTEGSELPKELSKFSKFEGKWNHRFLERLVENAAGYGIRVQFKSLSSTHGGFATVARGADDWKMRIVVHDGLDEPSRSGVLCHELAHILLGHLGSDFDGWWPSRANLSHASVEVEAEAVAWIVTTRLGLSGSSATYLSRHLKDGQTPAGVSLDMIGKTAGLVERMATKSLTPRKPRKRPEKSP